MYITDTVIETPIAPIDRRRHTAREVAAWNLALADAQPADVIGWAVGEFGNRLCLTASFADTLLIDFATNVDPDIEVVFIDTGFHFPETLQTVKRAMARYSLNLTILRPVPTSADPWAHGVDTCCGTRKIAPLERHLIANADGWMSGLRRDDSTERATAPVVSLDRRGLVKVNPLVAWSAEELDEYATANDVLVNPLAFEGYPSIGCWPCTTPADSAGTDKRAGRWAGSTKTECGIHS